jgi:microcystin degradation protein MlrC
MIRVAIGGLGHETNTYAATVTGITERSSFMVARGAGILAMAGTRTYIGGMLAAAEEAGIEVVPTFWAYAYPSGTIGAATYRGLRDELVAALRDAGPVDAVCLELHGAAVAEGVDDVEGDVGRAVREVIGDVPLTCALDLHGNLSDDMAALFDAMFGNQLYPHTDSFERGHEAMAILPRLLAGELRPVTHIEHLPMLLPTSTTEPGFPAAAMNEVCADVERRPGVVDCTVFHGFPHSDSPLVGVHVVVTTDGDAALARSAATEVGDWVWEHREDFTPESLSPEVALAVAARDDGFPVVINDTADNPGGGTPGDATHVLRAFLEAGLTDACFAMIADPAVVRQAIDAGVGASIDVHLGGKHDELHGAPIAATAYVHSISDGRVTLRGPMLTGVTMQLGPMCRLRIGGVDVIVSSAPSQTFDPEVFLLHGIDVRRYRYVGLKGSQHFRAGFAGVAARVVTADSPGLTTLRMDVFDHASAPRPMWPIDTAAAR